MYKRVVSIFALAIMLTTLISYRAFASTETPSPMVYATNTQRYMNDDLQVFTVAEIDSAYMTEYGAHVTQNVLQGTTHDFYYDADYVWIAPMQVSVTVVNHSDDYIVIPNGAIYNNWTMTYTDYSNNGQNTQGSSSYLGYYIDDSMGVVYQTTSSPSVILKDDSLYYADDIIIEPGQNKTYQYTVNFCFKAWTHNNANIYDPFDCNISIVTSSSISGINDAYTSSIDDFITGNDIPYSVIAYLNALVTQGIEDQSLYNAIINQLSQYPTYNNFFSNYVVGQGKYNGNKNFSRDTSAYGEYVRLSSNGFKIVNSNYKLYNVVGGTNYGNRDILGTIDLYVTYNLYSTGSYDVIVNPANAMITYNPQFTLNGWTLLGADYEVQQTEGFSIAYATPYDTDSTHSFIVAVPLDTAHDTGRARMATNSPVYFTVKFTYYFGISDTTLGNITSVPTFSNLSPNNFNTNYNNHKIQTSVTHSVLWYLRNWWESYSSNQPQADDVTDDASDVTNDIENQHQQEATYYSDTNTAINNSGLDTYTFDSNTSSGLNGLKNDFTLVWNACGSLGNVWILSLTLSLALYIIRHRRMFHV